jgi:hypothetical protein
MFNYFYHERIRKSVAMFGSLFNGIYVLRKDASGQVLSQVKVPLAYAPREKFLDRIRENPDLRENTQVAVKLPRMSFEMTSLAYAPERQLNKQIKFNYATEGSITSRDSIQQQCPYTLTFQLNVYARQQDDALQIVEQIIPYFNPQYSLTIKPFSGISDFLEDVPIVLNGVTYADDYEGALEQRRTIIYTLDFSMHASFYGPIESGGIIRDVRNVLYTIGADSDIKLETIQVLPNPLGVSPDSDFGFTTNITLAADSAAS